MMKQLTLVKQSRSVQLARLYEHLFYDHITEFLYKAGLFQYIDYSLKGVTYNSGIIQITLELYNSATVSIARQIPSIDIRITQKIVSNTIAQLLAEREEPFAGTSYEKIEEALLSLHAQPWQNIDELDSIDTKQMRRTSYPFYICEGDPLPARKLTSSITIDPDFIHSHRHLLPLFRQIALSILFTAEDSLTSSYGYYGDDNIFMVDDRRRVSLSHVLKVAHQNDIYTDIGDNLQTYLTDFNHMKKYHAFERLSADLKDTSYTNHPLVAPNLGKNHDDTHILIGSKGWHKIATTDNVEALLKHMHAEIKFGRKKVSTSFLKY